MDIKKVLDKVARLRQLATSSNLNEAAAAAAAADRLMQQHNIAEAELEAAGEAQKEAPEQDADPFAVWAEKRVPQWQRLLAWRLISHYDCSGIEVNMRGRARFSNAKASVRIVGRRSDIEAAKYMYAYLTVEIERLAQFNRGNGRRWLDAFRHGAVRGCLTAMATSKQQVKQEARAAHSTALVLIDTRQEEAKAVVAQLYPERGKGHGFGMRSGSGFRAGLETGRKLGQQHQKLESSTSGSLLQK